MLDCAANNKVTQQKNTPAASNKYNSGSVYFNVEDKMNCNTHIETSGSGASTMDCDMQKGPPKQEPLSPQDEDDPVVHEIPVFLAQSLSKQLFLYQVY